MDGWMDGHVDCQMDEQTERWIRCISGHLNCCPACKSRQKRTGSGWIWLVLILSMTLLWVWSLCPGLIKLALAWDSLGPVGPNWVIVCPEGAKLCLREEWPGD